MKIKTHLVNDDSKTEYDFECYENTEPIEIGDKFIFFFFGGWDVQTCCSENEKSEINKHDRPKREDIIDMTHNFWENCYKIKTTNFDLSTV
jgi:hypothetical protein